jgi:hypothetical protein
MNAVSEMLDSRVAAMAGINMGTKNMSAPIMNSTP